MGRRFSQFLLDGRVRVVLEPIKKVPNCRAPVIELRMAELIVTNIGARYGVEVESESVLPPALDMDGVNRNHLASCLRVGAGLS